MFVPYILPRCGLSQLPVDTMLPIWFTSSSIYLNNQIVFLHTGDGIRASAILYLELLMGVLDSTSATRCNHHSLTCPFGEFAYLQYIWSGVAHSVFVGMPPPTIVVRVLQTPLHGWRRAIPLPNDSRLQLNTVLISHTLSQSSEHCCCRCRFLSVPARSGEPEINRRCRIGLRSAPC